MSGDLPMVPRRTVIGRLVPLLFVAAFLTACASTREMTPREPQQIPAAQSVVVPPPGGPAIVSVVETVFPNAIRHDAFLATNARTPGENKISVTRFIYKGGDGSSAAIQDIPFTNINLTQEANAAWPGTGMAVSPFFVQNNYGPFGYAISKPPNGDTCIYAWQRIAPTLKPSGAVDRGTINIRLQLCRRGVTEAQLLDIMYQLRLNAGVYQPPKAAYVIGAPLSPIRPIGVEGFAEVIPTGRPATSNAAPAAAPRPTPTTRPAATPPTIPVGAPIVPSPSGMSGAAPLIPRPPASTSGVTVSPSPSGSVRVPAPPAGLL